MQLPGCGASPADVDPSVTYFRWDAVNVQKPQWTAPATAINWT